MSSPPSRSQSHPRTAVSVWGPTAPGPGWWLSRGVCPGSRLPGGPWSAAFIESGLWVSPEICLQGLRVVRNYGCSMFWGSGAVLVFGLEHSVDCVLDLKPPQGWVLRTAPSPQLSWDPRAREGRGHSLRAEVACGCQQWEYTGVKGRLWAARWGLGEARGHGVR